MNVSGLGRPSWPRHATQLWTTPLLLVGRNRFKSKGRISQDLLPDLTSTRMFLLCPEVTRPPKPWALRPDLNRPPSRWHLRRTEHCSRGADKDRLNPFLASKSSHQVGLTHTTPTPCYSPIPRTPGSAHVSLWA